MPTSLQVTTRMHSQTERIAIGADPLLNARAEWGL